MVTRTQLETAVHDGLGSSERRPARLHDPVVTHPDEILRTVATAMAAHGIDRMPVVSRDDPRRIVGLVSLTMLLAWAAAHPPARPRRRTGPASARRATKVADRTKSATAAGAL